jgi:hypothetical protein
MKNIKIYTLKDPIFNKIRYVGKTKYTLKQRLAKHLVTKEKNYRGNWIRSILKQNLVPIIELIEEIKEEKWVFWEKYWISQFKTWGFNLVNATEGGESGIISDKCRKACIKVNIGKKQTPEFINIRLRNLRKRVLQFNKNNVLINEFKSASEAARKTNSNLSHITECCNNIRKTHNSFIWKYK